MRDKKKFKAIKREISILEYDKYYSQSFYCQNCGERNYRAIRKGKRLDTVTFICDKCGCVIKGVIAHNKL